MLEIDRFAGPGQSGLLTRLSRVGLLLDAFQHRVLDEFGLRFIDFSVLRVLLIGGPMSPGEMADITVRSTGGMTQIVDRLVRHGFVARTPDPHDRRKVVVGLTPKGQRLVEQAGKVYERERARVLGPLSEDELGDIDGSVRRLLELFEGDAAAEEAAS